jgi:polar amino acid transport system substrate-binding protein
MMRSRWIPALITAFVLTLPGCPERAGREAPPSGDASLQRVKKAKALSWGTDVVGGVPYVYEDPDHPGTYIGFEHDLATAIARQLGVEVKMVIKAWDTLIPELQRESFDMAMNGIEDTEDRGKIVLFSEPYFVYAQQLTVRRGTKGLTSLLALQGKKVGTLSGTAAEDLLRAASGIEVVTNPEIIYSYRDLEQGKVDAVLLDTPIAAAYAAPNPKLENVGDSFAEGHYVIAFRQGDSALRDEVNAALEQLKASGELKAIYTKWGIMDAHQQRIGIL